MEPIDDQDQAVLAAAKTNSFKDIGKVAAFFAFIFFIVIIWQYSEIKVLSSSFILFVFCFSAIPVLLVSLVMYFTSIAKINKDLSISKKFIFKTKIIDKSKYTNKGVTDCKLMIEKNNHNIKRLTVDEYIYDEVPLFSEGLVSVSPNAHILLAFQPL